MPFPFPELHNYQTAYYFYILEKIQERISEQYIQGLSELDEKKNLYRQSKRIIQSQSKSTEVEHPPELFKKEDGVWRPTLLTLGMLRIW